MRIVYLLLILMPFLFSCQEKESVSQEISVNSNPLAGKWKLVSKMQEPETTHQPAADTVFYYKIITEKTFTWVIYTRENGELLQTAGGRYTLEGEKYTEFIDYIHPHDHALMSDAIPFRCQLSGDRWTHSGYIENRVYDSLINDYVVESKYKLEEIWERVE